PRLATFKPTLYLSGRQHANEVSSTSYILMLADRLAHDPTYADYPKKINFVLHPLENPDGASLAYDLQKLTPDHSLHAGRYSSLGLEIGYQTDAAKPLLPEAQVRRDINAEWLPDIYLNLHGYPSHEWVQAFSNYSPFLFREYWIPKGWFAYYRAVTNPYYRQWQEAGQALERTIIRDMQARAGLRESNAKFYDRYFRWATRWQPHLNELELHDGLNLIQKRRSSQETKPDNRTRITYIEETPELMDETAQGGWLRFLTEQGLTYLLAHIKYLSQARFDILRLEEEVSDRVRIQFFRSRPGVSPGREQ
ncbi:MAG: M14 family metallopeptidase, partial [Candidatus Aminicenantes bacterium]|nr:M14 family metallopeptidase [Candidatus Aminicenantes bacterium]